MPSCAAPASSSPRPGPDSPASERATPATPRRRTWFERAAAWLYGREQYYFIPDRDGKRTYLRRYYLTGRVMFEAASACLHHIRLSDTPELHDHPWPWVSLVIRGGYWEHTWRGRRWRGPGSIAVRSALTAHRVELDPARARGETWTLFLMGPKRRRWGFFALRRTPSGRLERRWIAHAGRDVVVVDQLRAAGHDPAAAALLPLSSHP